MTVRYRRLAAFALLLCACGCGKHASSANPVVTVPQSLVWSTGVDPAQPDKALPIAPVVAPVKVSKSDSSSVTTVFQTKPSANCQLEVAYDRRKQHQLLPPAVADASGLVRWTWHPDARGHALARIVCSGGQRGEVPITVP
jgi:hypothetical protein